MIVVITLGNRLKDDGTMSKAMLYRLKLTEQVIKAVAPNKVILSGGIANDKTDVAESTAMRNWLIAQGVDAEILIEENKSMTTKENALFSVPIALSAIPTAIILITDPKHMHRAYLNPKKLFAKQLKEYDIPLYTVCKQKQISAVRRELL